VSRRPLVTVLMSTYNDASYLAESVESVLGQTFGDFEFLIVDDGSTDGTRDVLGAVHDPRVRVRRNAENLGLTRSLNLGLDAASGQFVARMDADDVCFPERLARQVEFLQSRPDVGIVGCSRELVDERGRFVAHASAAEDDSRIRWKCLLGNPFAHPTVMLRRDVLDRNRLRYDKQYRTAQDYELWTRLLAVTRGANLREPLLKYRLRAGVSKVHNADQVSNHDRIARAAIDRLVPEFSIAGEEVRELRGRFGGHSVRDAAMDPAHPYWKRRYLELRDAFATRYGVESTALAA
jgi:glycosyltransferase involved in cell wall biosynthesis